MAWAVASFALDVNKRFNSLLKSSNFSLFYPPCVIFSTILILMQIFHAPVIKGPEIEFFLT